MVTAPALQESYECTCAGEETLRDMDKIDQYHA